MPFLSRAQQKWMYANHPDIAKRWSKETPDFKSLPDHVKKNILKKSIKKDGKGGDPYQDIVNGLPNAMPALGNAVLNNYGATQGPMEYNNATGVLGAGAVNAQSMRPPMADTPNQPQNPAGQILRRKFNRDGNPISLSRSKNRFPGNNYNAASGYKNVPQPQQQRPPTPAESNPINSPYNLMMLGPMLPNPGGSDQNSGY